MSINMHMSAEALANSTHRVKFEAMQVSTLCFGAYLYFIVDYFIRFSARIPSYGAVRPTLLMFVIITISLFLQKDRLRGKVDDPIFKAVIALFAYLAISLPFVEWPGSVIRGNAEIFIRSTAFLFFTTFIIASEKRLRVFLWVFLSCQVFRILEPLYLHIRYGYWGSRTHVGDGVMAARLSGAPADVINPNELGFVIVTAIPFLHYFLWYGRWYAKLVYLALMPLLVYALVLTMSRGAFLALLVVAWMILRDSRHKLVLLVVGFMIIIGSWNAMSPVQQERYRSLLGGEGAQTATAEGRIQGIISEFKLGFNRPIVGHGLGTTIEAKTHFLGRPQASHNFYAELLIEIGIIGAVIFLIFLKRIYLRFASNRKKIEELELNQDHFFCRLNMAMIAVFWMYVVYSINYWGLSQYYWYLFGGMAIVFGRIIDKNMMLGDLAKDSESLYKR